MYWDGTGLCLFAKTFEQGRFRWPKVEGGAMRLSPAQLAALIEEGLGVDYNGLSGALELSTSTGDLTRAMFDWFGFDEDGNEVPGEPFEVSI